MPIEDLINNIIVNDKSEPGFSSYNKRLDDTDRKTKSLQLSTSGLTSAFGQVAGIASFGLALKFVGDKTKESIALAQEQRRVEAQLDAVLRSTGNAAGFNAEQIKTMASELQGVTNFGDEATIAGQNLLLTFTNIKEVFPDATTTMLDMSAALGQDLKSSAIQLGKALNDPVKGVTALQRVGVSFSAEQKNLIATLVESGRITDAQRIILAELNREFGGSAAAAREADGGFIAAKNAIGDLQEIIGNQLIPSMEHYNELIIESAEGWGSAIQDVGRIQRAIGELSGSVEKADKDIQGLDAAFLLLSDPARAGQITIDRSRRLIEGLITPAANAGVEVVKLAIGEEELGNAFKRAEEKTAAATEETNVNTQAIEENAAAIEEQQTKLDELADLRDKEANIIKSSDKRIQDAQFDHAQRLIRINEDLRDAIIEAASDATKGKIEAETTLSQGLAEIERDLATERAEAIADFNRSVEKINTDRAKSERKTARDIAKINSDLQKNLRDLERDTTEKIDDLNIDLAKRKAENEYKSEQDRLKTIQDFENKQYQIQQNFANKRLALQEQFSNEFEGADPFRRQILEFNRKEQLKLLDQQESDEQNALASQRETAISEIQERIDRENEILDQDAAEKTARIEREANERRESLQVAADERREALRQRLADDIENYNQRRTELERQLNEEQARRDIAAETQKQKLQENYAEELARIDEQEAEKVKRAQEAIENERKSFEDRMASIKRRNEDEIAETSSKIKLIEILEKESYLRRLKQAMEFSQQFGQILQNMGLASGTGGGSFFAGGGGNETSINATINNYGVPAGYQSAIQTARNIFDIVNGGA